MCVLEGVGIVKPERYREHFSSFGIEILERQTAHKTVTLVLFQGTHATLRKPLSLWE